MARGFRRKGSGKSVRYAASLDALERATVTGLMEQVRELLAPPAPTREGDDFAAIVANLGMGVSVAAQDQADSGEWPQARDPALDRLLPSANVEDPEAAAEFRRLTETGLRQRKADALTAAIAVFSGDDALRLDPVQARTVLVALTDVRLVLGERMGLRADDDLEALEAAATDDESPLGYALAVYDFLTWLQETLAGAMLGR